MNRNNQLAQANAKLMQGIFSINLMSSPGAGKTTLLEETLATIGNQYLIGIVEGDIATSNDAERLRKYAKEDSVYQIKTENYGGSCHLDAKMVETALKALMVGKKKYDAILIENVGNLICPADFNLGEDKKVVMLSVTEGDDKPLKYPGMFAAADLVILSKTDLLKYVDFDINKAKENIRRMNPKTVIIELSAKKKKGMKQWIAIMAGWIDEKTLTL